MTLIHSKTFETPLQFQFVLKSLNFTLYIAHVVIALDKYTFIYVSIYATINTTEMSQIQCVYYYLEWILRTIKRTHTNSLMRHTPHIVGRCFYKRRGGQSKWFINKSHLLYNNTPKPAATLKDLRPVYRFQTLE